MFRESERMSQTFICAKITITRLRIFFEKKSLFTVTFHSRLALNSKHKN